MGSSNKAAAKTKTNLYSSLRTHISAVNKAYSEFWRAKVSWQVTLAIFVSIFVVQSFVATANYNEYKVLRQTQMVENARSALATVSITQAAPREFLGYAQSQLLFATTKIQGLSIYASDFKQIEQWGQPTYIKLTNTEDLYKTYNNKAGYHFERVFKPSEIGHPFYIVARIDAENLIKDTQKFMYESISIVFLIAALMTTLLMSALGLWFFQPIVFLTKLLKTAIRHPEQAPLIRSQNNKSGNPEILEAIEAASALIEQNALHIQQIKASAEDRIRKVAYFDPLTDLPNRPCFLDKIADYAVEHTLEDHFVVIALDLDHFRDINDSMGHNVGDIILKLVGSRLQKALPERAIVARTGEDSFAVMLPIISGINTAEDIAKRVAHSVKGERFKVMDEDFRVHCSIGYAIYPEDGQDADQVLKNAEVALNRAKEEGRDIIRAYSRDFDIAVQSRFQLLRDLRIALEKEEFELHFQPQFDLKTEEIIGAEALIRWWKPDQSKEGGKYISPGEFIPIAESSGLIVPIGDWVTREACMTGQQLKDHDLGHLRIAVNVSGVQFRQKDLVETVRYTLHETGLNPRQLEIEVTESAFMEDITHTTDVLRQLHELGIELAIDDFGTGYSSLAYLRQFPIDRLKIDRSFIINALNNPDDASIARTIIALGNALNLRVLAEGVETEDHQKFLMDEGCSEVQGFRYARPMPKDEFFAFCKKYNGKLSQFNKK